MHFLQSFSSFSNNLARYFIHAMFIYPYEVYSSSTCFLLIQPTDCFQQRIFGKLHDKLHTMHIKCMHKHKENSGNVQSSC